MHNGGPLDWLTSPLIYQLEWCLLAGLGITSLLLPRRLEFLRSLRLAFERVASNRALSVALVITVVAIGRAALLPWISIPRPAIADEFGYLLTADTFLHGRLTNPTSPMWIHFETIHTFHVPTYQSQYPIGYPLVLAISWSIFHNPWWGVFLTTALMCGALTWMLQAWVPARWALLGGLLAAVRVGLFSYWMNSFWGGSLAALGGCLFWGSVPRLAPYLGRRAAPRLSHPIRDAVLGALGLAILANTRPFEGLLVSIPGIVVLIASIARDRQHLGQSIRQVLIPSMLIASATVAGMMVYQKAVTGHALKTPYAVAAEQYHVSRPFLFQAPGPIPKYRNPEFRFIYVHFELMGGENMKYLWGFLDALSQRCQWYWRFYVGPLMTLPLLAFLCHFRIRERGMWLVWIALALLTAGVLCQTWIQVHYLAPAYGLFVLILIHGVRYLRATRIRDFRWGQRFVSILPLTCVSAALINVAMPHLNTMSSTWASSTHRYEKRENVEDTVNTSPGKSLVIVRYRMGFHNPHEEWVYNGADLVGSKILWARSMSAEENCELVRAYADRTYWIVDHWGAIVKLLPESAERVCDPQNPIYEANYPQSFYTSGQFRHWSRRFLRPRQTY